MSLRLVRCDEMSYHGRMNEAAPPQEPSAAPGAPTCKWDLYPDGHRCPRARAPRHGTRGPQLRDYCEQADAPGEPVHNPGNHWLALKRLRAAAQADGAADTGPGQPTLTMTSARLTGAELLQSAAARADQLEAIAGRLREAIIKATDPATAEAEIAEIQAAADQRVQAADERARQADQRAADADGFAETANAAAEQMSEELDTAQMAAADADEARQTAETTATQAREDANRQIAAARDEAERAITAAREDANRQIAAARDEAERAIAAARDEAGRLVTEAEAARAQAVQDAARADEAARLAKQEAAAAKAAAKAKGEELDRYRDDVDKMLDRLRADAERERERIRTDWQDRTSRAEDEADRLRRQLEELLAAAGHDTASAGADPDAGHRTSRRPAAKARRDRT